MFDNNNKVVDQVSQDTADHLPTNVNASAEPDMPPRYSQSSPDMRAEAHAALIEKRKEAIKDPDNLKKSRSESYNAVNIYVDKMMYGEQDRDDSDVEDDLNTALADKTPNTKRRMIKEDA